MTQQEINHEIALFDGWKLARIGTYYYKGPFGSEEHKIMPIGTLNYFEDWNLAHSAWIRLIDIPIPKACMPEYWLIINKLKRLLLSYEKPDEFSQGLYYAIQWYNNLNKQNEKEKQS